MTGPDIARQVGSDAAGDDDEPTVAEAHDEPAEPRPSALHPI